MDVIELGDMGEGMAGNLQKAGYPMVVYDLREGATRPFLEGGANLGHSQADVASRCDVTLTSLPGPREVELVSLGAEGVLEGAKPGSVYIDLSTSRPTLIREIEPKFRAKGVHVLDAPVSGGKSGAQSRNLAVMVGGDKEVFERVKPLLEAFGDKVFYAGAIGAGSVAKLVHNMIGHGVDAESLWQCIRRRSLCIMNILHEGMARTLFRGEYEPASFALNLARKDVGLATELGREFNVPMPVANLAEQIAIEAINRGWGEMDSSVTFRLQEEQADVEVRAPQVDVQQAAKFIATHPEA